MHVLAVAGSEEEIKDRSNPDLQVMTPGYSHTHLIKKELIKEIKVNSAIALGPFKYQQTVDHLRLLEAITEGHLPVQDIGRSISTTKALILDSIVNA